MQGEKSINLQIHLLEHPIVIVKDSEVELGARVHHVELKRTLRPGHPTGGKSIINDVSLRYAVFVHDRNECICFVAKESASIKLRKSIATNNFHIKLAQFTRADVNPVA